MSSGPAMLAHLFVECLSRRVLPRVQEPDLSGVDSLAQSEAFELAGREDGFLASIYLYQALQIAPLVRPGDRVLDLGCGPANQLVQVARLNPQAPQQAARREYCESASSGGDTPGGSAHF